MPAFRARLRVRVRVRIRVSVEVRVRVRIAARETPEKRREMTADDAAPKQPSRLDPGNRWAYKDANERAAVCLYPDSATVV